MFNYLNTKSLNQLFINVIQEPTENWDISSIKDIETKLINSGSGKARDTLIRKYENRIGYNLNSLSYDVFFITNIEFQKESGGSISTTGGIHKINKNGGALFLSSISDGEATAHELGHWLGFYHPFQKGHYLPSYRIIGTVEKHGQTQNNFMDYFDDNGKRKSWFWYQLMTTKTKTGR